MILFTVGCAIRSPIKVGKQPNTTPKSASINGGTQSDFAGSFIFSKFSGSFPKNGLIPAMKPADTNRIFVITAAAVR
ncbi:hypothetical protein D3C86_1849760 [compost metagenome]